jgi:hypothetical protein
VGNSRASRADIKLACSAVNSGDEPGFDRSGHRDAQFLLNINTRWSPCLNPEPHVAWTRELWNDLLRLADGVYVNFLGEEGAERVQQAYGTATYERLVALKNRWDPANLFRVNQNIPQNRGSRQSVSKARQPR